MLELWTGTPGSGKSLHLAHEIRSWLRLGKRVISTCNINTSMCFMTHFQEFLFNISRGKIDIHHSDIRERNFSYVPLEFCSPEFFYRFAARYHVQGREHQTLICLDECLQLFSSTVLSQDIKLRNEWDTFFRIHRHLGYDIIMIPQSKRLLSRSVAVYAETEIRHFNRKHYHTLDFFLSLILGGFFSYSVCWRGDKKPLEQHFFTYRPFYGQMYDSYSYFGSVLLPYKSELDRKRDLMALFCGAINNEISRRSSFVLDEIK